MEECIAFRLRVAGFTGPALFSEQAMAKIKAASGGVPREINRICINAMQLGFALRQRPIGLDVIEEVMADLTLAKWIPETELPVVEFEAPKAPSNSVGFRVGAQSAPRPAPLPVPPPAAVPQVAAVEAAAVEAKVSSRPVEPLSGKPVLEVGNSLLPSPESELRRVLLGAAARRQRAAELRLLGLRYKESQAVSRQSDSLSVHVCHGMCAEPSRSGARNLRGQRAVREPDAPVRGSPRAWRRSAAATRRQ